MTKDLTKYGSIVDPSWVLMAEEPVEFDDDHNEIMTVSMRRINLSAQDNNGYIVRYRYSNKVSLNSRSFCRKMTALSASGTIYTKEEIIKMGKSGINSEWSMKGKKTYSIWLYKGGGGCRHGWWRQIYLEETGKQVAVAKAKQKGFKNPKNPIEVATPSCVQKNAGFVTKNGSPWKCN